MNCNISRIYLASRKCPQTATARLHMEWGYCTYL